MNRIAGIRHEDKYLMERRTPIIPVHVKKMVHDDDLQFVVESSPKRVFTDQEYIDAGASAKANLSECPVIFGVKEIPPERFEAGKTYVFFSHVIKGQAYNMPMLARMMELGCNLIDYERIVDDQGKRLIFFGKYAGLAGMINSLWSMGQRLRVLGYADNPFLGIKQAMHYDSLQEAKEAVSQAGFQIATKGIPQELRPLTIGFTGYGNVSQGAQEIAALLPIMEISPEELKDLNNRDNLPGNLIYKVVFREKHLAERKDGGPFELQDYYKHPEKYTGVFEQYIPHLSILMNCMYWDARYPRILTKAYARELFKDGNPKLTVIGDVTCDPDGSVELTHKGTEIEDPVFVYNPETGKPSMGFQGKGLLVMAVDILPSELPRDSSVSFSEALSGFVKSIIKANYDLPYREIDLPNAIKTAMILHKGKLTPNYEYISEYLK